MNYYRKNLRALIFAVFLNKHKMESCKISSIVQCVVGVNTFVHKDNYEMVIMPINKINFEPLKKYSTIQLIKYH